MKEEIVDKQTQQDINLATHPTKKNLIIFGIIWVAGNGLLVLSTTDLFTETFFSKKYVLIYAMMIMSTVALFKVLSNYFRVKWSGRKFLKGNLGSASRNFSR